MQSPASSGGLYMSMRLQRLGSMIILQPFENGRVAGASLTCDLRTGSLAPAEHPMIEEDYIIVHGALGLMRLYQTAAMVVITGAEQVGMLRGSPVYKVTSTEVMGALQVESTDDNRYLSMLEDAMNPAGAGRGLYFSYEADITLTTQRAALVAEDAVLAAKPLWARADARFFWNKQLAALLLEAADTSAHRFVVPAMMGMFRQLPSVTFAVGGEPREAMFTLIARRSVQRAGCRFWRRGIDLQGNVANFVESEQLIQFPSHKVVSSYVQTRGSMPLLWSQAPNIKYKPPTYVAAVNESQAPFERHISGLLELYREVTAMNLANQHGSELRLGAAYAELSKRFSAQHSGFRLVAFDFHKECGATNYARLSVLWDQIRGDFEKFGYYVTTPKGTVKQKGVFRTNCVDSLDRTNVVQGLLGRKHLEAHLAKLGALTPGASLASAYPDFDNKLKNIWADHGDEISCQYAGTGALKSQFTRTGRRDIWGLLDDGQKSAVRYYLNNFFDGDKQDALDLVTFAHRIDPGKSFDFKHQASPLYPFLLSLLTFYISMHNYKLWKQDEYHNFRGLVQSIVFPLAMGVVIMGLVVRWGRRFVKTPQLRPDLVKVWEAK